jgi:hypothetical protein
MISSRHGSKSTGLGLVLVQSLLAGVFVLNTMAASVYERRREIGIFSAIGLAPNHIGALFLAESLVYGVVGAVLGYFLAQGMAKAIVLTGILPGLYLNFGASSAVLAAAIVIAVVLLSAIYPARIAATIAAPSRESDPFESLPTGDRWEIPMPFSLSRSDAEGLLAHFASWLKGHEEYAIGDFVTSETRQSDTGSVESWVWPAPYDLGVSQRLQIRARPSEIEGISRIEAVLMRTGGEPSNWILVNRRFLEQLRRQFLTWRTRS